MRTGYSLSDICQTQVNASMVNLIDFTTTQAFKEISMKYHGSDAFYDIPKFDIDLMFFAMIRGVDYSVYSEKQLPKTRRVVKPKGY